MCAALDSVLGSDDLLTHILGHLVRGCPRARRATGVCRRWRELYPRADDVLGELGASGAGIAQGQLAQLLALPTTSLRAFPSEKRPRTFGGQYIAYDVRNVVPAIVRAHGGWAAVERRHAQRIRLSQRAHKAVHTRRAASEESVSKRRSQALSARIARLDAALVAAGLPFRSTTQLLEFALNACPPSYPARHLFGRYLRHAIAPSTSLKSLVASASALARLHACAVREAAEAELIASAHDAGQPLAVGAHALARAMHARRVPAACALVGLSDAEFAHVLALPDFQLRATFAHAYALALDVSIESARIATEAALLEQESLDDMRCALEARVHELEAEGLDSSLGETLLAAATRPAPDGEPITTCPWAACDEMSTDIHGADMEL